MHRLLILLIALTASLVDARPILSEVMAAEQSASADEDGDFGDWVELFNPESQAVDLSGWSLTDDSSKPERWRFPAGTTLAAQGYLLVYCSGKNRSMTGAELHTDFSLAASGETVTLSNPAGQVISVLQFDQQFAGVSYDGTDYRNPATPGAANTGGIAITRKPTFSHPHGFKTTAFKLTLRCSQPNSKIYYTLDGTEPGSNSLLYSRPLTVSKTTAVRAVAVAQGSAPSAIVTQTYLFASDMVKQSPGGKAPAGWPTSWGANKVDYGMDPEIAARGKWAKQLPAALKSIPTMAITMALPDLFDPANGIYANPEQKGVEWERPMSLELIDPNGGAGFQTTAGLRIRGGASRTTENPKHSFRVLLKEEYGAAALNYPLFGPEGAKKIERFDLRCEQLVAWHYFVDPNADFIRDIYARSTQGALGQPHTRSSFYHLVINGQYWGLYQTEERVGAEYAEAYFGGEEKDYDAVKVDFDSPSGGTSFIDGSFGAWRRAVDLGRLGFENDANYFRIQGLAPDGTRDASLEPLIDVDSLIDYMLAGIYNAVDDSPPSFGTQNNWSAIRSRKGDFGFRFFAHDWEISMYDQTGQDNRVGEPPTSNPFNENFGGSGSLDIAQTNGWHFWQAMRFNAEFRLRVADHVQKHFFDGGVLTQGNAIARWRNFMDEIDEAVIGESARWGDARPNDGFDGAASNTSTKPFTKDDWLRANNDHILGGFLANRSSYVLSHLMIGGLLATIDAPSISPRGGTLPSGQLITFTPPSISVGAEGQTVAADVYFTTNGTDPRRVGGGISAKATRYTAPFELAKPTVVKARALHGGQWSALVETRFEPSSAMTKLRISELHYNPALQGGDDGEFIELHNTGTTAMDMSGVRLSDGIDFALPSGTILAADGFLVIAKNVTVFESQHGFTPLGPYTGRLNNDGETIALLTATGVRISSLEYDDDGDWPTAPDGFGHSLVYDGNGDPDDGGNWMASNELGGSPGRAETAAKMGRRLVINEITNDPSGPRVELHNPTANDVSLLGWRLTSGAASVAISASLTVPANGYHMLPAESLQGLAITPGGGTVALQDTQTSIPARDRVHRFRYGPLLLGAAYGRYTNSEGREFFPLLGSSTPAESNGPPVIHQIRISEILYQPQQYFSDSAQRVAPPDFEFIEIENTAKVAVDLSGCRLGGLGFEFPSGTTLVSGGMAIVTPANAELFRLRYAVPAEVLVFGAATGDLSDTGEMVTLEQPHLVDGVTAYLTIDEVRYDNTVPWPAMAAGRGQTLQRFRSLGYGPEPQSWGSGAMSPGLTNTVNSPPSALLTVLPSAPGSTEIRFDATGSDADGSITSLQLVVDGQVEQETVSGAHQFVLPWRAGVFDVWLRVTDDEGLSTESSQITFAFPEAADGAGMGLLAEYFPNQDLTPPAILTEVVTRIGGDWFHQAPAEGLERNNYSIRYSGKLRARHTGTHSLDFATTGGLRVSVNGAVVIDAWYDTAQASGDRHFTFIELAAGEAADLVIEYFDADGLGHLGVQLAEPGEFEQKSLKKAMLYLPTQDPSAPAIADLPGVDTLRHGQRLNLQAVVVNAPVSDQEISFAVDSGLLPPGLSLSPDGRLRGTLGTMGVYPFTVSATWMGSGGLETVTRQVEIKVLQGGNIAPKITLTSPTPVMKTTAGAPVLLAGTTQSVRPIQTIRYSLNETLWHDLPAGAQWQVLVPEEQGLWEGANTLKVQAEDVDGRRSEVVTREFVRQIPSHLTVTVQGAGTVSPGYLGISDRAIGQTYTITAYPAPGFIFAGWEGGLAERREAITFTMSRDLAIEARFVPSPFTASAGGYSVLFGEGWASQMAKLRVQLLLSGNGAYSGMVNYLGHRLPLTGRFAVDGSADVFLPIPGSPSTLSLFLYFDFQLSMIRAQAYLSVPPDFANYDSFMMKHRTAADLNHVGRWNLPLPSADGSVIGTGFMSLTVSPTGSTQSITHLPSGRSATDSSFMAEDNTTRLYATVRQSKVDGENEAVTGILQFPAEPGLPVGASAHWASAVGDPNTNGQDRFAYVLEGAGYPWVKPTRSQNPWPVGSAVLFAEGSVLRNSISRSITLGRNPVLRVTDSTGNQVLMKIDAATGQVRGLIQQARGPSLILRAIGSQGGASIDGYFRSGSGVGGSSGVLRVSPSR